MITCDYHSHTLYCDGANSPVEMIEAAIRKNMTVLGFSGHSYTDFDEAWCMSKEDTLCYKREIQQLKVKYKERLEILCGVEQDYYSKEDTKDYDYFIGSVHYIKAEETYLPVDETKEQLKEASRAYFGDDIYSLIELYYQTVSDICRKTDCQLIGHFDLISKFNEDGDLFDENHPRYIKAYREAADRLIPCHVPFEINVGAIFRGYRSLPYPSFAIMQYIHEKGGCFLLSGDSHATDGLCYEFERWEKIIRDRGYHLLDRLPLKA